MCRFVVLRTVESNMEQFDEIGRALVRLSFFDVEVEAECGGGGGGVVMDRMTTSQGNLKRQEARSKQKRQANWARVKAAGDISNRGSEQPFFLHPIPSSNDKGNQNTLTRHAALYLSLTFNHMPT